ncbi:MAG TPA: endonuclease/exonuclease/phosphatase family protein [Dysgonamonadaceae bacterium]|nr:endonuclease/exonuclease/phosphatase family protein [Dysgonamonadaceae bacterium]
MKKLLSFTMFLFLITLMFAQNDKNSYELNIATYNLRMDTHRDSLDAWVHRKENVNGLIRFHDFDIMGTQEGFHHQLLDITEPGDYDYVGAGRDDGKDGGEHSAIVYKTDRFEVLDKGDFWFSLTPNEPSFGWDAKIRRICSWAKFKDKEADKEFFFFSLHYDHQAKEARRNSSLLLIQKIREIAGDAPVFCVGDFNATPDDEPMQIIYDAGFLHDSRLISQTKPYGTEGTFNAFRLDAPMKNRIDYIWVTEGITIKKYGVLNDVHYGHFPSDHFPVMVTAAF